MNILAGAICGLIVVSIMMIIDTIIDKIINDIEEEALCKVWQVEISEYSF